MRMGTEKNRAIIGKDLEALQQLILVAKEVLEEPETRALERTLRYFAVCLANSSVAVATLCGDGFGADALKISRSMFENYITFRYLLLRPEQVFQSQRENTRSLVSSRFGTNGTRRGPHRNVRRILSPRFLVSAY